MIYTSKHVKIIIVHKLLKYKSKLCLGILFVILSNIFSLLPAKFIGDAFRVIELFITNTKSINYNKELLQLVLFIFLAVCIKGLFMFLMR